MADTTPAAAPPAEAFARLFESVHEGVYIGTLSSTAALTLSANPFLKLMFGYAAETPQEDVRPFELERFVDPQARDGFVERLQRDGAIEPRPPRDQVGAAQRGRGDDLADAGPLEDGRHAREGT